MTEYLTIIEVLAIHDDQIQRYGGAPGIRDLGLLEAALYRPQTGYYADLIAEAAALWESPSQNHPFIAGKKRTAFATVFTFLLINGASISASADEIYTFIMGLYEAGTFDFERLSAGCAQLPHEVSNVGFAPLMTACAVTQPAAFRNCFTKP